MEGIHIVLVTLIRSSILTRGVIMMSKEQCRRLTSNMVHRRFGHEEINLPMCFFACKVCGDIENIEIHHEVYPQNKYAILRAIHMEKIYMLCHKCHRKIDGFKDDTIEKTNYSDDEIKEGTMVKMAGCFGVVPCKESGGFQ
jgi:hypothetical protein